MNKGRRSVMHEQRLEEEQRPGHCNCQKNGGKDGFLPHRGEWLGFTPIIAGMTTMTQKCNVMNNFKYQRLGKTDPRFPTDILQWDLNS